MYYIFNKNKECIASCVFPPNIDDLETRGEYYVENEEFFQSLALLREENGEIKVLSPDSIRPTYEDVLNNIKEKVNSLRISLESEDIIYNNNKYQTDKESLDKLMLASNIDEDIKWKTSDNTFELLTNNDINNIIKLIVKRNSEILVYISDTKDKISTIEKKKNDKSISEDEAIDLLLELNEIL